MLAASARSDSMTVQNDENGALTLTLDVWSGYTNHGVRRF
jgi:hypothetical protein